MEDNDLINICVNQLGGPGKEYVEMYREIETLKNSLKRKREEEPEILEKRQTILQIIKEIVLEEPSDDMDIGKSINFRLELMNNILNGLNK